MTVRELIPYLPSVPLVSTSRGLSLLTGLRFRSIPVSLSVFKCFVKTSRCKRGASKIILAELLSVAI